MCTNVTVEMASLCAARRRDGLVLDGSMRTAVPLGRDGQGHEEQADERSRHGRGTAEEREAGGRASQPACAHGDARAGAPGACPRRTGLRIGVRCC
jgi:hypothetical protein